MSRLKPDGFTFVKLDVLALFSDNAKVRVTLEDANGTVILEKISGYVERSLQLISMTVYLGAPEDYLIVGTEYMLRALLFDFEDQSKVLKSVEQSVFVVSGLTTTGPSTTASLPACSEDSSLQDQSCIQACPRASESERCELNLDFLLNIPLQEKAFEEIQDFNQDTAAKSQCFSVDPTSGKPMCRSLKACLGRIAEDSVYGNLPTKGCSAAFLDTD